MESLLFPFDARFHSHGMLEEMVERKEGVIVVRIRGEELGIKRCG